MGDDIYPKVASILEQEWDPIGISGIPEAKGEYDGYVVTLIKVLEDGGGYDEILHKLSEIKSLDMGLLNPIDGSAKKSAKLIMDAWVSDRKDKN